MSKHHTSIVIIHARIVCYLFLVSFLTCSTISDLKSQEIKYLCKVDLTPTKRHFNEIVEDFKYIKLETSEDCFLGNIKQVCLYQSNIYTVSEIVHCFDLTGKFLFSIDKKGRGPGEFLSILSISFDDNKLYVTSPNGKMLVYDSRNGKYLMTINLGYYVTHAYVEKSWFYADRASFPNPHLKHDARILIGALNKPEEINGYFLNDTFRIRTENQLSYSVNSCLFTDQFNNYVYKLSNGAVSRYIKYDFGRYNPTKTQINQVIKTNPLPSQISHANNLTNVTETKDFIIGRITIPGRSLDILFDKNTGKSISWDQISRIGRADFYQYSPVMPRAISEEYFYYIIDARLISNTKDYLEKNGKKLNPDHPHYLNYKAIRETSLEDNPIIALYKFKRIQ